MVIKMSKALLLTRTIIQQVSLVVSIIEAIHCRIISRLHSLETTNNLTARDYPQA